MSFEPSHTTKQKLIHDPRSEPVTTLPDDQGNQLMTWNVNSLCRDEMQLWILKKYQKTHANLIILIDTGVKEQQDINIWKLWGQKSYINSQK